VAEAMTGATGVTVSLQETLQDVQRIIDGTEDQTETKELMYIGRLA
jgi:F-type H+-transporting ATPase subunit beta